MAKVVFGTWEAFQPLQANALYVWADLNGPLWGPAAAYQTAQPSNLKFPADQWWEAIGAASEEADRTGIAMVYVARSR